MAPNADHITLLRAVIREDFSMALCDALVTDIARAVDYLEHHFGHKRAAAPPAAAAPAGAATPAALPSSASWNAKHEPHRVHTSGKKKHAGVC